MLACMPTDIYTHTHLLPHPLASLLQVCSHLFLNGYSESFISLPKLTLFTSHICQKKEYSRSTVLSLLLIEKKMRLGWSVWVSGNTNIRRRNEDHEVGVEAQIRCLWIRDSLFNLQFEGEPVSQIKNPDNFITETHDLWKNRTGWSFSVVVKCLVDLV